MTIQDLKTILIIGTSRKGFLLSIALPSVLRQTKHPDALYIVSDEEMHLENEDIFKKLRDKIRVKYLLNQREKNLSGAINTALYEIIGDGFDPENTYVAVLDDDDWWEPEYLQSCFNEAINKNSDWIISGIVRHSEDDTGINLTIPESIAEWQFLRGNPHVQGSNLFVRLSKLLMAGGYDENLPSTTDRDVSLRLLALGDLRISFIKRHMVHHRAYGSGRLSDQGSKRKCQGLKRFYFKYQPLMDRQDEESFHRRSKEYFGCNVVISLDDSKYDSPGLALSHEENDKINIIIGVIVSDQSKFPSLIQDVLGFHNETQSISAVVVSDNAALPRDKIEEAENELKEYGINLSVIQMEEANEAANRGVFGEYYIEEDNRTGIAFGRTVLHRYVYLKCLEYGNPVVWILDDDVSLKKIYWGTFQNEISPKDMISTINRWQKEGVSIVIGKVGGDPPVPVMSTLRTQMIDLYYNLRAAIKNESTVSDHPFLPALKGKIEYDSPAYFYDFPDKSSPNLETPFWLETEKEIQIDDLSHMAAQILTKAVFRKAFYQIPGDGNGEKEYLQMDDSYGPVRGGNTIILDIDSLKDFNNSSPRNREIAYRRGDTLWVVLNKRLGQRKSTKETRKIISTPMMLIQYRNDRESDEKIREKFVADVLGSAFVRTMDSYLLNRIGRGRDRTDYYSPLRFTEQDLKNILITMEGEIESRARQIILNAWRIMGLIQSIRNATKEIHTEASDRILKVCEDVERLYNISKIDPLIGEIRNFNRKDLEEFLNSLYKSQRNYSGKLPVYYSSKELKTVKKKIMEVYDLPEIRIIGQGYEGIVLSDGIYSYKYFHYGSSFFKENQINFLKHNVMGRKFQKIANLIDIHEEKNTLIFKKEYVKGQSYKGGHLNDMVDLIRECKSNNLVIKNLAPKNIVVEGNEFRFVDLGNDIEPYTDEYFDKMCRRAYLTYRWHFREDLHELLTKSNSGENFPEMFGYDYFLDIIETKNTGQVLMPFVLSQIGSINGRKILDYGSGNGIMADHLATNNDVSIYDIDMTEYNKKHPEGGITRVLHREELDRISSENEKFDTVILSLVLCTIDDGEALSVLKDVRRVLRKNGDAIIVICNPFNIHNKETATHKKLGEIKDYRENFSYEKKMIATHNIRKEYHRPAGWYLNAIKKEGFVSTHLIESEGASFDYLSPGSEFLLIRATASYEPLNYDVSLMIKASPMEWRSIDFQIRHLVNQLEGPERFREKFIVTDRATDGFAREYDEVNLNLFESELNKLVRDGVIDFILYGSDDPQFKKELSERWFGIQSTETRCSNGQPVLLTLEGFEKASSKYILQIDSDCIIHRRREGDSYLKEMMLSLQNFPNALTVSFPVFNSNVRSFSPKEDGGKWRTEVRNCLLDRTKILNTTPLPNSLCRDGKLKLPWHRSLDKLIMEKGLESLRGSKGNAYFLHISNSQKKDINFWYNALKYCESYEPGKAQEGNVEIIANDTGKILELRKEKMIVLVKGRDIPIPKIRRCFKSLRDQDFQDFGIIYVDAASHNGSDEYVQYIGMELFKGRITFLRNFEPLTSAQNIFIAIKKICANSESIIVMVDSDDALIGKNALSEVMRLYDEGTDLTIGTMLRTDKYREYNVNFESPRTSRGGNVWQHLRTFRKYLFDLIDEDDLKIEGKWIEDADDWAYMIPMTEMAKNPMQIKDKIYFYEPSPGKRDRDVKRREEIIAKIISKRPYEKGKVK